MSKRYKCKDGSYVTDDRETLEEWSKQIGGVFATILELQMEKEAVFALIRTNDNWDGIRFKVPDEVTLKLSQFQDAFETTKKKELEPPHDEELPF